MVLFKEMPPILPISIINRFQSLQGHWSGSHFTSPTSCDYEKPKPRSVSDEKSLSHQVNPVILSILRLLVKEPVKQLTNANCRAPPCFWKRISWRQCFEPHVESREGGKFTWKHFLIPGFGRFPWRREWQPTPVFLLGEFRGQRGAWWARVHRIVKS